MAECHNGKYGDTASRCFELTYPVGNSTGQFGAARGCNLGTVIFIFVLATMVFPALSSTHQNNRHATLQSLLARATSNALKLGSIGVLSVGAVAMSWQLKPAYAVSSTNFQPALLRATAEALPAVSEEQAADQFANQGVDAFTQHDYLAAYEYWQQAMLLYRMDGRQLKEARMLENLSVVYRVTDRAAEAINMSQQALNIYDALDVKEEQPSAFLNMGSAYRMSGQLSEAIAAYSAGLTIYRQMDDQIGQRILLSLLADTYAEAEAYPQSIDAQTQLLDIAQRTGNIQLEAESLSELAYAHFMSEQHAQAVGHYQSALTLFQQLGDRPQEVAVLNNLGRAAYLNQDFETALTAYQRALDIFSELNRPVQTAHLWVNIGQAHVAAGDLDAAIEAFQQSVNLAEMIREQQADSTLPPRLEAAYRELAVLLQQENRGSEAQQILGLI